ncbi:hypothetical protein PTKIN_Ptkin12aG0138600 [Pterospermum kingtungense]
MAQNQKKRKIASPLLFKGLFYVKQIPRLIQFQEVGVEKTLSCSGATDAKGYFFATVSHLDKLQLKECKAYLQSSPDKDCNVPTNINQAIDGALLTSFTLLKDKRMKLYSVRPFYYAPKAKLASNVY